MKVKVCGITTRDNLESLIEIGVDMIGFNFYHKSKRYVNTSHLELSQLSGKTKRVGVFVNSPIAQLINIQKKYKLDYLQLHGNESPNYVSEAKQFCKVIKVFSVKEKIDMNEVKLFDMVDLFLFDTFTKDHGGSGRKFNWKILEEYKGHIPFLLAGGITSDDLEELQTLKHEKLLGVDINSGFENAPGVKNIDLIDDFYKKITDYDISDQ